MFFFHVLFSVISDVAPSIDISSTLTTLDNTNGNSSLSIHRNKGNCRLSYLN